MTARETARRLQCSGNLRGLGVALQQYHQYANRLPAAWSEAPDGISGYGWAICLLPYLEEGSWERRIDNQLPIAAAENGRLRSLRLGFMLCPSDIAEETFALYPEKQHLASAAHRGLPIGDAAPLLRLPAANYLGVFGTVEADDSFPAPAGDGSIISGRRVRFTELERGQSHTLLVGERTAAMAPSTWLGVDFHGEDAACRLVGSAMTGPNCVPCDECEFSSRHCQGTNFVWADGHVELVVDDISPVEYRRLAKRRMD
jgi:prepilin-type processing-associated H-X9-DG protein